MPPLPDDSSATYNIDPDNFDPLTFRVPGELINQVVVRAGSSGSITWTLDLDAAGIDEEVFIGMIGKTIYEFEQYYYALHCDSSSKFLH